MKRRTVTSQNVKYRSQFGDEELRTVERIVAPLATRLGYRVETDERERSCRPPGRSSARHEGLKVRPPEQSAAEPTAASSRAGPEISSRSPCWQISDSDLRRHQSETSPGSAFQACFVLGQPTQHRAVEVEPHGARHVVGMNGEHQHSSALTDNANRLEPDVDVPTP